MEAFIDCKLFLALVDSRAAVSVMNEVVCRKLKRQEHQLQDFFVEPEQTLYWPLMCAEPVYLLTFALTLYSFMFYSDARAMAFSGGTFFKKMRAPFTALDQHFRHTAT